MAAVSFSGFNGIDFGSIIDSIITSESTPLTNLQKQQTDTKSRDTALASLSGGVGTMETQANTLIDSSLFTNVTASSDDIGVGSATVGTDATSGEYSLHVDHLAKTQVTASFTGYSATTATVADGGSISFTIGADTTTPINISSATTLSGLRDAINAQSSGVVASIVNTGTANKLVISSRTTGESNGFKINNTLTNGVGTALAFAGGQDQTHSNSQDAKDAAFTINGIDFTSNTNTTSDAIPGLALKLSGAGDTTVSVTPDYGAIQTALKSFITTYNQLRQFATIQNNVSSTTGQRGPLANDSVLRQTLADTRDVLLSANNNGGKYKYLSEIGVTVDQTGNLQFDQTAYTAAITDNPDDVKKLFQGVDNVKGVFGNLKDKLQNLDGTDGMIKDARDSIKTTLQGISDRITATQLRLDMRKAELQKEYAAADQAISKLNSMTGQLSSLGSAKLI